jgi:hypothetical protein
MEDTLKTNQSVQNFDKKLIEDILDAIKSGSITENKSSLRKAALKILSVSCDTISDALQIALNAKEIKLLKINFQAVNEFINSKSSKNNGIIRALLWEIKFLYDQIIKNSSSVKLKHELDLNLEILANSVSHFLTQRAELIVRTPDPSIEFILENVVIFAASQGGLAFEEALNSLVSILQKNVHPISVVNQEIFIDLIYEKSGHPTNIRNEETRTTVRRWYPDVLSKAAIIAYLSARTSFPDLGTVTLKTLLKNLVSTFNKTSQLTFTKNSKFLQACFKAGIRRNDSPLPYFMEHYATGELYSPSMPLQSLLAFNNKKLKVNSELALNSINTSLQNLASINIRQLKNNAVEYCKDHEIIEQIKNILRAETDDDQSRLVTLNRLKQLHVIYDFNVQVEIIHEWVMEGLSSNRWKHARGTGIRYLNAIANVWVETWKSTNIKECGSDEMDSFFEEMILQRAEQDSTVKDTLTLLFIFIAENYALAVPEWISEEAQSFHVRSELIPEHHFERLRVDIAELYFTESDSFKQSLDVFIIFLRRGFFRPSEVFKLQMRDIESSNILWVYLRRNAFGGLKTASSNRKVPLGILLKPQEYETVENFIRQRKVETEGRKAALLFSQQTNHDVMFNDSKIRSQITELLSSYDDLRIVSYQFRHTSISFLQLIIFSDIETTRRYTGYTESQIKQIRRYFIAHQNDLYYQISSVVGHISPNTTITTYSHFTDLLLNQYLMKSNITESIQFWSKLSGFSETRISSQLAEKVELNQNIDACQLIGFFDKQLKKYSTNIGIKMNTPISPSRTLNGAFEPSLAHCERILKEHSNGNTRSDISATLTLSTKYVIAVIEAAQLIKRHSAYQTSRGKSRLVNSTSDSIRPTKMQTKAEDVDRLQICELLLKNFAKSPKFTKQLIHHLLSNVANDHSYLSLNTVKRTGQFIHFFQALLPKERWYIILHPPADYSDIEKWQSIKAKVKQMEVSDQTKKNKNMFPQGQAKLYLMHPNSFDIKNKRPQQQMSKYSTNSLKNACHWVAIHLKSLQLYTE